MLRIETELSLLEEGLGEVKIENRFRILEYGLQFCQYVCLIFVDIRILHPGTRIKLMLRTESRELPPERNARIEKVKEALGNKLKAVGLI
ncbi:MAG: hypothetical protein ACSHXL_03225 [Bacteroidota bacterium]